MKTRMIMTILEFKRYKDTIEKYNDSLPVGITQTYTNRKLMYFCNNCTFKSKHKYDTLKHYTRIHINGGKSKF